MILLLYALFILLLYGIDFANYEPFVLYCIVSVILAVIGFGHLILLSKAVKIDAKDKKLNSGTIWSIFIFLAGLPCWIIYALFTFKAGGNKSSRKSRINICVSFVLLAVFISGIVILPNGSVKYAETHFSTNIVTYENSEGEDIVYDKMGNAYTFDEFENFRYYDRDGNSYYTYNHDQLFSDIAETDGIKCIETGKEYTMEEIFDFYIDEEGYLVIFSLDGEILNSKAEYQSDDEFYDLNFCSWSPEGELLLRDDEYTDDSVEYIYNEILKNISY